MSEQETGPKNDVVRVVLVGPDPHTAPDIADALLAMQIEPRAAQVGLLARS